MSVETSRKDVIKHFNKKGIDGIGEFCACYMVSLVDAYEIVKEYTDDFDIKQECEFKINTLNRFYSIK
jgi:hypothetical protein